MGQISRMTRPICARESLSRIYGAHRRRPRPKTVLLKVHGQIIVLSGIAEKLENIRG
jgi:hypothetical protein